MCDFITFYVGHCVLTVKEILPHSNMLFSGPTKLKPKSNIKHFFGDVVFSLTPTVLIPIGQSTCTCLALR
jgi:hypothetical protein